MPGVENNKLFTRCGFVTVLKHQFNLVGQSVVVVESPDCKLVEAAVDVNITRYYVLAKSAIPDALATPTTCAFPNNTIAGDLNCTFPGDTS